MIIGCTKELKNHEYRVGLTPSNVATYVEHSHQVYIEKDAGLVIGCVLIPGASTPRIIRKEHLKIMKKGAVIVDISIDQGGIIETSRVTTHKILSILKKVLFITVLVICLAQFLILQPSL